MLHHRVEEDLAPAHVVGQPLHAQEHPELGIEQVDIEWLGDVVDHAQGVGALDGLKITDGRQDDDRHIVEIAALPNALEDGEPVQVGQHHVERHQRRPAHHQLGERGGAVPGRDHVDAKGLRQRAQQLDDPFFVLASKQDRSRLHVAQASPGYCSRHSPLTAAIVPFSRQIGVRVNTGSEWRLTPGPAIDLDIARW